MYRVRPWPLTRTVPSPATRAVDIVSALELLDVLEVVEVLELPQPAATTAIAPTIIVHATALVMARKESRFSSWATVLILGPADTSATLTCLPEAIVVLAQRAGCAMEYPRITPHAVAARQGVSYRADFGLPSGLPTPKEDKAPPTAGPSRMARPRLELGTPRFSVAHANS